MEYSKFKSLIAEQEDSWIDRKIVCNAFLREHDGDKAELARDI